MDVTDLITDIESLTKEIQELYLGDRIPWIVGYSGGKDSTATLQLVWNAIAMLPPEKRNKTVYVITTDTLVENPIIADWVKSSLKQMEAEAEKQQMPFKPILLLPEIENSFWVCLIGKGYPAPRNNFRWCTDRLKIKPSNHFIRQTASKFGEVILILGVRKAESITRKRNIEKHEKRAKVRDRLTKHSELVNALIYAPIQNWSTENVWLYLMQYANPWGYSNKDLFVMYRGATADNECPLVVDTSTPSCGDSRFGCWVCTMVAQDKSMAAMIDNDEQKEWMLPLLELRNELDIQDDRDKRDFRRLTGQVDLFLAKNGEIKNIPGPYTKEWRQTWLRKLLTAQQQARENAPKQYQNITLITDLELSEIRYIWTKVKHEFDDALPQIYKEVTGIEFKDPRWVDKSASALGEDEWELLQELTDNDQMQLELLSNLLGTVKKHEIRNYSKDAVIKRRRGIYEDLEKCFDKASRNKEDAIAQAQQHIEIKEALKAEDTEKLKQLTWGALKYNRQES